MVNPDPGVSARLESLEREVKRLAKGRKSALVFCLLIVLYILSKDVATAARPPVITAESISAKRIVLQGIHDSPDIVLGYDKDGLPGARFYDSAGRNRLGIGIAPTEGGCLVFFDPDGKKRAGMTSAIVEGQSVSELWFSGPRGNPYLTMGVTRRGSPRILFFDDQNLGIYMAMDQQGRSQFQLRDPDGRHGISLMTDPKAEPSLTVAGKDDRTYGLVPQGRGEIPRRAE